MAEWLQQNWVTIVTVAVLALLVCLAIRKIVKDKKEGIGSCGCKCSECAMRGQCAQAPAPEPAPEPQPETTASPCGGDCSACPYSAKCNNKQ